MTRIGGMVVALALSCAGIGPALAVGEFESGRWTGQAFFERERFTHCAMFSDYVSRWKLLFSIDHAGEVTLGLASEFVDMYPWDNAAQVWLQVDNNPVLVRNFKNAQRHLMLTRLGDNPQWIARLRKGQKLKVNVGKRVPNFDLAGIDEAFAALYACAKKHNKG